MLRKPKSLGKNIKMSEADEKQIFVNWCYLLSKKNFFNKKKVFDIVENNSIVRYYTDLRIGFFF